MKVLFIVNHLNTGGITSYCLALGRALTQRGHKVFIGCAGGKKEAAFAASGMNIIRIPINTKQELHPKLLFCAWKLKRAVRLNSIDIIHAHTRTTQVLACILSKLTGRPYISTCHGFFKRRLSRRIFPCWGRRVIAVSAEVAGHLEKDFKVAGQRIELVNNGIDAGRFCRRGDTGRNRVRRELGVGDSQVLIGSVGRLSDVKGHIYLVEAMKEVVSRYPQAQLLIVGEGKMKEEILALRSLLKLEKNIQLIPGLDDTREALAAMDIFVMPSLKEGLGLALMEAMASGLPVVASDVGGIKSLVSDGVNGLLVSPGKPALIAQALLRLIASPEERAKLGSRAVSDIINNYPLEQMAQKTERAYEQCLK